MNLMQRTIVIYMIYGKDRSVKYTSTIEMDIGFFEQILFSNSMCYQKEFQNMFLKQITSHRYFLLQTHYNLPASHRNQGLLIIQSQG